MKHEEIIAELHELAKQVGVTVRYEKGDFEGGYCVLKDQGVLLINKRLFPQRKSAILAIAINEIGLDNVYVKPALREYIEDEIARSMKTAK